MIKITDDLATGWKSAVYGMRNPMNSWNNIDSTFDPLKIGENDLTLMKKLALAGSDHAKYRRMIVVYADITAPLYWWKEFDTYKVSTVANSCSTMHKIHEKEFTFEDFSTEHLLEPKDVFDESFEPYSGMNIRDAVELASYKPIVITGVDDRWVMPFTPSGVLVLTINMLNKCRELYLETKDKKYWWQMIQLLPSSYNQLRTVMLNYEVLSRIYFARHNHKLDEWHDFCKWIESLPYASDIIFPTKEETDE